MVVTDDREFYMASSNDNNSVDAEFCSTKTTNNKNVNKDNSNNRHGCHANGGYLGNEHVNPAYDDDSTNAASYELENPVNSPDTTTNPERPDSSNDILFNSNSRYGWKWLSPKIIQILNKPSFFLFFLCFGGVAQGFVVTGIAFTVLTSIEKQFGYKSSEVALFGTAYDTAYGICCLFVGYIGHAHKPRCIGWGLLIMVTGAVLLSIPKFAIGTYRAGIERSSDFCQKGTNITSFDTSACTSTKEWYYNFLFIVGNILLGIGATPLYTLAPAHIDEVTDRGQGSLYMGIYYAACAVGPALGFIIGLPILNAWVDLKQPPNSFIKPTDTNWVGAWWLGYLVGAGLLLLPVLPILGFPKEFPNADSLRARKRELEDTVEEDKDLKHDLGSVWPATKALFKNVPYLFISLAIASESLAIGGFSTFIPKFVQTQFNFTASSSALYTGIIVIPGAAGGIFMGGYLVKRFKMNCKEILRSATIMAFLATIFVTAALVGCKGRTVVANQGNRTKHIDAFTSSCNQDCHCSREFYKPICTVEDQKTYYSPCHAGCSKNQTTVENGNQKFHNCSCFSSVVTHAIHGRCTSECTLFPLFVVLAFLLMFFTFMNNVPMLNATFRVVNEGQGSFAMGFQQIFVRFLGFIPAPVIFGALIDKSCVLWQTDRCTGETTSCLEYQQADFRYYMFTLGVVTKFASFIFIFIAYKIYKLPEQRPSPVHEHRESSGTRNDYDLKQVPNNNRSSPSFRYSYDNTAVST